MVIKVQVAAVRSSQDEVQVHVNEGRKDNFIP